MGLESLGVGGLVQAGHALKNWLWRKGTEMGEIADMMIDGLLDYETGELIDGDSPGHPRTSRHKHCGGPQCPDCGKRLKNEQGVTDHRRDVHGVTK